MKVIRGWSPADPTGREFQGQGATALSVHVKAGPGPQEHPN